MACYHWRTLTNHCTPRALNNLRVKNFLKNKFWFIMKKISTVVFDIILNIACVLLLILFEFIEELL